MAEHAWSAEARYFQGLCSELLKPHSGTGSSCFAEIVPKKPEIIGTLDVTLNTIQSTITGEIE